MTNKYVITGLIFVFWVMFVNDIDLLYVLDKNKRLNEIKAEVEQLKDLNDHTRDLLEDYQTNPKTAEQFAREEILYEKTGRGGLYRP